MSDLTIERPAGSACVRTRAALVRARRETMRLVGEAALLVAAAASATTLLAGAAHAPSASFVVQCAALGAATLWASRARTLRAASPALALAATVTLLIVLALEVLRSGAVAAAIPLAGTVAVLPVLAVQVTHARRRTLAVAAAALCVVLAALGAGLPRGEVVPLAAALAAASGVVLAGLHGLDRSRTRRARRRLASRAGGDAARPVPDGTEETVENLSHDLRNPLAIALGFAEMAADAELGADDRAQALAGVRRSLWEISQLVDNVLDGSADRAGALHPCRERVALEPLCREALAATQVLLRGRPISLTGSVEPGLEALVDRHGLARVLGNLLGNAAKYTERGEIRLVACARGDEVAILVSDTGPGIAPEAVPFIFERFRRAQDGTCGAGLAVESTLGAGSTFAVTLPRAARAAEPHRPTHVAA